MTPQDIFDTAVIGVLNQWEPSIDLGIGRCLYRHDSGLKCAAGFLLDDEAARVGDAHGCGFARLVEISPEVVPKHLKDNKDLVTDLQIAHDVSTEPHKMFIHQFRKRAAEVAEKYKLSTAEVDEFYAKCIEKEKVSC